MKNLAICLRSRFATQTLVYAYDVGFLRKPLGGAHEH